MKKWIISLLALAGIITGAAAQASLHVYTDNIIPPTVTHDSIFNVTVKIKNTGNASFSGNTAFSYQIDTNSYTVPRDSGQGGGVYYTPFSPVINPGDSIAINIKVFVNSPAFISGPSVVVIWPVAVPSVTTDSLKLHFTVLPNPLSGINDPAAYALRTWYYGNYLYVQNPAPNTPICVRIFDQNGRLVLEAPYNEEAVVDVACLPKGCYITELLAENKRVKVLKFIKLFN